MTHPRWLACITGLVGLLAGCDTPDDRDGDGVIDAEDCAPDDPAVRPGAAEVCDGVDNNCDEGVDEGLDERRWYIDDDGDGVGRSDEVMRGCRAPDGTSAVAGDCDDQDASTYPGAPETCDGRDHDCDGAVDDPSVGAGYADRDGDGYGDPDAPVAACPGEDGVVADATDCDDTLAGIHPGAGETCLLAGVDEDCDGLVDGDDPEVEDRITGWPDGDGDGFGDGALPAVSACVLPAGYVPDASDCDDTLVEVHPDAPEPDCAAGLDYNCDGVAVDSDRDGDGYTACADCDDTLTTVYPGAPELCDEEDNDCDGLVDADDGVYVPTWYQDLDGDGYGNPNVSITRCEAPETATEVAGDCDDDRADVSPDGVESCVNDRDENCDGNTNVEDTPGCTAFGPDADGDGWADAAADTRCFCEPDDASGAVAALLGDCDDADPGVSPGAPEPCGDGVDANCDGLDACLVTTFGRIAAGTVEDERLGSSLVVGWDLDGDGIGDLVAGAPGGRDDRGEVRVLPGPIRAGITSTEPAIASTIVGSGLGYAVAVGDGDGDGFPDVYVGAPDLADLRDGLFGAVYRVEGPVSGSVSATDDADAAWYSDAQEGSLGTRVGFAGDIAGDGDPRVALGDVHPSDAAYGAVLLVRAGATGTSWVSDARDRVTGVSGETVGGLLAAGQDLDGDGTEDLLVGTDQGTAVILGPVSGSVSIATADARIAIPDLVAVRLVDDLDGDSLPDLLAESDAGIALYSELPTAGTRDGTAARWSASLARGPTAPGSPSATADLDADGAADVVTRETGDATVWVDGGRVLVFLGPLAGTATPDDAAASWSGDGTAACAGWSVEPAGDLDGDGRADLIAGGLSAVDLERGAGDLRLLYGSELP